MDKIINTKLLGHPLNWLVVGTMLALWGIGLHAVTMNTSNAASSG